MLVFFTIYFKGGCMKTASFQKRKATFVLDEKILNELKQAVKATGAKSVNALVKTALQRLLDEVRKMKRRKVLKEAASDPLFLEDIREVEQDFVHADTEFPHP